MGYGQGPPPANPTSRLPQLAHNRPPPSPAPPPDADSPDLYQLFLAANSSQSGTLSESELGSALVNADYTAFDPYTIKMMMRMFSSAPRQDFVSYEEFVDLWRFLAAWRELFERFDEDRSGRISLSEFSKALVAFGYRLSSSFTNVLYNTYNEKAILASQRRGSRTRQEGMSFDLFVQACISLKRMTDVFKGYDDDRDGYVTLSFEEFLMEILRLRE
jgi:Ca2+-binding EF-hand superfamily protein